MWKVNEIEYELTERIAKQVLIDSCTQVGQVVPRFCYHELLRIAGNCRMCLIEDSKAIKPVICCAMNAAPDLSIFTETVQVKKSREYVMEFLLINHPLDCPICDQGGECDLQDLSLVYGADSGRYYEYKRSVEDKDCGPVVKTIMNRCILCTRCVRFAVDIAGFQQFGITGRGVHSEIGSYLQTTIDSDLSGNLVDICPVGALTLKPYSFVARPWELKKGTTWNLIDDQLQLLKTYTKEAVLVRVTPAKNTEYLNQWITNRTRFSHEGITRNRKIIPEVAGIRCNWLSLLSVYRDIMLKLSDVLAGVNYASLVAYKNIYAVGLKDILSVKSLASVIGSNYFVNSNNSSGTRVSSATHVLPVNNLILQSVGAASATTNVIVCTGVDLLYLAPVIGVTLITLFNTFDLYPSFVLWRARVPLSKNAVVKINLNSTVSALSKFLNAKDWTIMLKNDGEVNESSVWWMYSYNKGFIESLIFYMKNLFTIVPTYVRSSTPEEQWDVVNRHRTYQIEESYIPSLIINQSDAFGLSAEKNEVLFATQSVRAVYSTHIEENIEANQTLIKRGGAFRMILPVKTFFEAVAEVVYDAQFKLSDLTSVTGSHLKDIRSIASINFILAELNNIGSEIRSFLTANIIQPFSVMGQRYNVISGVEAPDGLALVGSTSFSIVCKISLLSTGSFCLLSTQEYHNSNVLSANSLTLLNVIQSAPAATLLNIYQ